LANLAEKAAIFGVKDSSKNAYSARNAGYSAAPLQAAASNSTGDIKLYERQEAFKN